MITEAEKFCSLQDEKPERLVAVQSKKPEVSERERPMMQLEASEGDGLTLPHPAEGHWYESHSPEATELRV